MNYVGVFLYQYSCYIYLCPKMINLLLHETNLMSLLEFGERDSYPQVDESLLAHTCMVNRLVRAFSKSQYCSSVVIQICGQFISK